MSDDFNIARDKCPRASLSMILSLTTRGSDLRNFLQSDHNSRARYSYLMLQESLLHWEESDGLSLQRPVAFQSKRIINFPVVTSLAASIAILVSVWFGFLHLGEHSKKIENSTASSQTPQTESLTWTALFPGNLPSIIENPNHNPAYLQEFFPMMLMTKPCEASKSLKPKRVFRRRACYD